MMARTRQMRVRHIKAVALRVRPEAHGQTRSKGGFKIERYFFLPQHLCKHLTKEHLRFHQKTIIRRKRSTHIVAAALWTNFTRKYRLTINAIHQNASLHWIICELFFRYSHYTTTFLFLQQQKMSKRMQKHPRIAEVSHKRKAYSMPRILSKGKITQRTRPIIMSLVKAEGV